MHVMPSTSGACVAELFHHDRAPRLNVGREACYISAMSFTRSVTFVILCAAQVGQGALAARFVAATPPDAHPAIEPVARKGYARLHGR